MKRIKTFFVILLFVVLTGCESKHSKDDLVIIDVSKSYPEKELILQDFMDVEYIQLETTEEFLTQGEVMAVGTEIILVKNYINDGDLFVFERKTGNGIRKINRRGQGGEEYLSITEIVLDEENSELFVIDNRGRKILVYDLYGNLKRNFKVTNADSHINTYNYDRDNLICYIPHISIKNYSNKIHSCHLIISKQDGSIVRNISIPFKEIKELIVRKEDDFSVPLLTSMFQIIPNHEKWVLMETSSDTIYNYAPVDDIKVPIIARIIHQDISRVDGVEKNPNRVRLLLRSLARNIATMASVQTVLKDVESTDTSISDKTFSLYYNALRRIFVIEDMPAWSPSLRSKTAIRTSSKLHFVDPSIATAVMRMNPSMVLQEFEYFGFLFEALCARDIRIYAQRNDADVLTTIKMNHISPMTQYCKNTNLTSEKTSNSRTLNYMACPSNTSLSNGYCILPCRTIMFRCGFFIFPKAIFLVFHPRLLTCILKKQRYSHSDDIRR